MFSLSLSPSRSDPTNDLLWTVYRQNLDHGGSALVICWVPATKSADLMCLNQDTLREFSGTVADAAAFDAASRTLWMVVSYQDVGMLLKYLFHLEILTLHIHSLNLGFVSFSADSTSTHKC